MKDLKRIKDEYAYHAKGYSNWEAYIANEHITEEDVELIAGLYSEELWQLINK